MQLPTELVEKYLYGMPFHDYCSLRFLKVSHAMIADGNSLFDNMFMIGRNKKLKPARATPIGKFSKKFIETSNNYDFTTLLKSHQNFNKKPFFKKLLTEDASTKLKFKKLRQQKSEAKRRHKEVVEMTTSL